MQEETTAAGISAELPALYTGMKIEVLSLTNKLIFLGRVNSSQDGVLELSEVHERTLPLMENNTQVKLRGFQRGGESFTMYGFICGCGTLFWRLDKLQLLQNKEQRKYFRQETVFPATVMCVNGIFSEEDELSPEKAHAVPCTVLDISGGGTRIICRGATTFAVDDWLFFTAADPCSSGGAIDYTCRVRRATQVEEGWEYGCEFFGLTPQEQESLLKLVVELQHRELRTQKAENN